MKMLSWLGVALMLGAAAAQAAEADRSIGRQLDSLGYNHEIDADGDYQMVFDMDDGRSQLVYVRSAIENYGSLSVREGHDIAHAVKDTLLASVPHAITDVAVHIEPV